MANKNYFKLLTKFFKNDEIATAFKIVESLPLWFT